MNWLVTVKTIVGNGSLQWTIFSFTRMCFPLTMTFEGVNNNILTPSCAYKQRSVVSLACVPLCCKRRPEDARAIEIPGLLLFESSKVNKNIYSCRKQDAVNIFPGKAKLEGRVCHFPVYSSKEREGNEIISHWINRQFDITVLLLLRIYQ